VVNNPFMVMEPLVELKPDLILMDLYMPECDGMSWPEYCDSSPVSTVCRSCFYPPR